MTRKRILSLITALAMALGIGGFAVMQATAAPAHATVAAASSPVLSTTVRALCIKRGTGEPRSLWVVADTGLCPEPYWGPATLEQAFGIGTPVGVVKPPVTSNPAGDTDPVLSVTSVGSQSVAFAWTADNPPTDQTVKSYCVRYKRTIDTWDTANTYVTKCVGSTTGKPTATTDGTRAFETRVDVGKILHATVGGLLLNTQYEAQVRAEYVDNSFGGWSNAVYPTTSATSTS